MEKNEHHHHDHGNLKGKKLVAAIILNLLITGMQVAGGLFSGSLALLTDALHNFSDVLALGISWFAQMLSGKKSTEERTFGYKRAEILAAMINAGALVVIALFLMVEAVRRFYTPVEVKSFWVIVLAVVSILFNGLSVLLLSRDAKENMNMKAAYLHMFTDMLTSFAVLAGGIAMKYTSVLWIDPVLSLLISVYLIYSSFSLLTETLKVLMQFTPDGISIKEIEEKVLKVEGIHDLHHVHIWQLNDHQIHFEGHIGFDHDLALSSVQPVFNTLRKMLHDDYSIEHVTLQPEYKACDEPALIAELKED